MPNPKRQHSKARSRRRYAHEKLTITTSTMTGTGSKSGVNHRVCPITGCYKGRQVVAPKARKSA